MTVSENDIHNYILNTFDDIYPVDSWGERSYFLNPGQKLKRGAYFATIKSKDGDNDKASNIDREGVFRLNIGITPEAYEEIFGPRPERPSKGGFVDTDHDFQVLDQFTPHPVYGWGGWICILNPSEKNFIKSQNYLENAYSKSLKTVEKRLQKLNQKGD